jgi:hypothetical protein
VAVGFLQGARMRTVRSAGRWAYTARGCETCRMHLLSAPVRLWQMGVVRVATWGQGVGRGTNVSPTPASATAPPGATSASDPTQQAMHASAHRCRRGWARARAGCRRSRRMRM